LTPITIPNASEAAERLRAVAVAASKRPLAIGGGALAGGNS
jgi:hypothetical protein